jgi:thymidylate synthase
MEIYTETCAEAHEAAIDAILSRHKEIDIQTHIDKKEFTLEFEDGQGNPDEIKLKIFSPLKEPQISPGSPFGPQFTAAYKRQFLTLTPPREDGKQATYTYWNRLEDYPYETRVLRSYEVITELVGDGKGNGFKQVTELIDKILQDENTRRGVMVTWNPILDARSVEPPCMNWVQVVVRNGKVHLRNLFRSQDMLLGLPENLVGSGALLEYITAQLIRAGFPCIVGTLTLISTIPHIYKKRDSNDLDMMRRHIYNLKMQGKWHPRVVG